MAPFDRRGWRGRSKCLGSRVLMLDLEFSIKPSGWNILVWLLEGCPSVWTRSESTICMANPISQPEKISKPSASRKKHWFQIRIDFYVLNRYRKRISYCLYHRKLGQFPAMRGLHLSPLWVGTFRQKKETHIVIWAKFFKLYQLFEIMGRQSWQKVFLCFYQIQFY